MKQLIYTLCLLAAGAGLFAGCDRPTRQPDSGNDHDVRNLIFLIGDGMGLSQISMLEIENEYAPTAFDRAQSVALMATRSANNRVTDSAAASTALATGTRTNNATLGEDPAGNPLESMLTRASAKGMATGIVVTSYLQHATPAAFYAHINDRNDTPRITDQLLSSEIDVLLGGGRRWLGEKCSEEGTYLDAFRRRGYHIAETLSEADTLHSGRLLGVFADEHLPNAAQRGDYLPQAVGITLDILSRNSSAGFMLIAEGSLIDMAGHANDAAWMLDEVRDFERAVTVAMDFADRTPGTLVVIAADHETGGLTIPGDEEDFTRPESGLHYSFSTKTHTAVRVPVYFYGTGADRFGALLDNTQLGQRIMAQLGLD